jgi:hypothetical protein
VEDRFHHAEDPFFSKFIKTCSNVPFGGGSRQECVVDFNQCEEGFVSSLGLDGLKKCVVESPPAGLPSPSYCPEGQFGTPPDCAAIGSEIVTCEGGDKEVNAIACERAQDLVCPFDPEHDFCVPGVGGVLYIPADPSADKAVVNYRTPSGVGPTTCEPPSGSSFPVGDTTVTCTHVGGTRLLDTFLVRVDPSRVITPTTIPAQGPTTTSPSPSPSPTSAAIIKNVNNDQVTVTNDRFTVQDRTGAVTSTPDCAAQDKTITLGPSPMQSDGTRILAAFDPCILTDGTVALNLPDEEGIELIAANLQGDQTTQSVVVPMQKMSPITQGQTLYIVDLGEQITGSDPASGNPATLNGNINALFLRNNGEQNVEFSADNTIALNAILKR